MKMLELERTATLRPFQSSKYCGSLHGFSRSVEREHRCRYAVADRGNWRLFEWIWGVSFFLSIMLAMAGWLYVLGTLSIKVVYWLAS
ncbi:MULTISPECIES: hypothetical protein [unclassified Bradyrhizobium]|uniref:hypothetical protein n=1 Tax=unclassified Bradyrhizobium TaxID=2631580 RepID=UPI001FF99424|nr:MULTISPECIES: hypothetical protein [unclassified Bradyrhizobium]MCK1540290.1 hypothetical protein [Bradyrhizobium sp. 176]MCK1554858.1 hypothetical protein [Bradyrhizobium sp. 171]